MIPMFRVFSREYLRGMKKLSRYADDLGEAKTGVPR
jgi:hypothetical protein